MALPNLLWLRSFEATSRHASFTAAAAELGLTQAAVSHHVGALEHQLGHMLFKRTTRRVTLTESGRAYLPSVRSALQDLALSTEALFGGKAEETVTIRAPISAAVFIITPALPAFQAKHPQIDVRLLSAIWANTTLDSGVDIEIRLGNGNWSDGQVEPLGPDFAVPICHPEVAKTIEEPKDLIRHNLIHILGFERHWDLYFENNGLQAKDVARRTTVDTSLAAAEWACANGGVALIIERAARRLEKAGRLAIPLEARIPLGQTHYLVRPNKTFLSAPAKGRVTAWLRALFTQDPSLSRKEPAG